MSIVDVWAQITTERMAKRPWLKTANALDRSVGRAPRVKCRENASCNG